MVDPSPDRRPDVVVGLAMIAGGAGAGLFGSLLGLGGGLLIVPLLHLGFGLPLRESVGVSLMCVIATSSASAAVFLQRRAANLRLGMTLELFTAIGAISGGVLAYVLDEREVSILLALLLVYVAVSMVRAREPAQPPAGSAPSTLEPAIGASATGPGNPPEGDLSTRLSGPDYRIRHLGPGIVGSVAAGVASALFGIGGGTVKVPLMHLLMNVPLRVATATSNLMMGVTASASAVIYLLRGGIDPFVVGPTAIGVFVGASVGSRVVHRVDVRILRVLFAAVLLYTALAMVQRALV
jgi:uncharacterized protein